MHTTNEGLTMQKHIQLVRCQWHILKQENKFVNATKSMIYYIFLFTVNIKHLDSSHNVYNVLPI
ncbi:hypothetical protein T12_13033 [Trichinella patagoniensis]|uniref:Uncharacterized protein n=1 Tax=Trichinella patagoniensis TaxID=990121 RepID=A0A0V1AGG6_9BILA|nr:hypothetical protein T12_13033 [Trichinella patagoniensis]